MCNIYLYLIAFIAAVVGIVPKYSQIMEQIDLLKDIGVNTLLIYLYLNRDLFLKRSFFATKM